MRYIILALILIIPSNTYAGLTWYTDYQQGMTAASKSRRNMVVYFNATGNPDAITNQLDTNPTLQSLASGKVLVRLPINLQVMIGGQNTYLIQHHSFAELNSRTGIVIVDYTSNKYFGEVVSVYPITNRTTVNHLQALLTLPEGSLTQRTLILAVHIHPERPASITGTVSPVLMQEAESHSKHQASINLQGHHNWNYRFNRIIRNMGSRSAQEVCAESWEGMGLFAAAIDCVHSWRQSSGHWGAVRQRHDFFGYDMKMGSNGIWYATGIFSSR